MDCFLSSQRKNWVCAEVTFIHPRKCMYRESKMSLVIANIPVMFPSCKLGSKSNVACATLWDTLALLHSQALQGKGRWPTPDCAANKSPSPISPNAQKRSVRVTEFLVQLCGEFLHCDTVLSLCSSNSYSWHSGEAACLSPHLHRPRVGSAHPTAPAGVRRAGREETSPQDAHQHYKADWA